LFSKPKYAIIGPMQLVVNYLPYIQIILSVVLVLSILLQQSGAGVGGALGGGDGSSFHHTRRGFELFLFYLSITCGILFALSAFLSVYLKAQI
jgi:protein translocase SecG subunit